MSELSIKVVKITDLEVCPNSDKLSITYVNGKGGYVCVVGRTEFSVGDLAIYIPENSMIPDEIKSSLNNEKIKVENRIRSIKIRGVVSEGLCLPAKKYLTEEYLKEGAEVSEVLKITKYEPPQPSYSGFSGAKGINTSYKNENFPVYEGIERFEKYTKLIPEGTEVVATVKMHGTNFRSGLVSIPKYKQNWIDKLYRFFTGSPRKEYLTGSHNVINKKIKTYKETPHVYLDAAKKYKLAEKAKYLSNYLKDSCGLNHCPDVVFYGEIIGEGIQKGYDYNISAQDKQIRLFDIMIDRKYVNDAEFQIYCTLLNLPVVEYIYSGPMKLEILKLAETVDTYGEKKYNREGIVIKTKKQRIVLKYINPAYRADKTNSDFH